MARKEYTSKQFCIYLDSEKAWELIEKRLMGYDIDVLDELYPDHFDTDKQQVVYTDKLKDLLLPKEQYYIFEGILDNYIITSFGRMFNLKTDKQCVIYVKKETIVCHIREIRIDFQAEFAKHNWPFSIDDIKRIYDKNKWRYQWRGIKQHYKK